MSDQIMVTVADEHLKDIDSLANQLRTAGMTIDQVLPAIGIITGSISEAQQPEIAALPGVAGVEQQQAYQLPPPDSDIQ